MSNDPQDQAEALDSDQLGTPDDVDIEPDFPLEQLLGGDDFGTTAAEEQVGEPLDERVDREQPDPLVDELETAEAEAAEEARPTSVTAQLDALELELDEETLAVIDEIAPVLPAAAVPGADDGEPDLVGRLVEPGVDEVTGLDEEGESIAIDVGEADLSAEESAMHLTEDPPMGRHAGDLA